MTVKLPGVLRVLAVVVLIAGVVQGFMAMTGMQALGHSVAAMVTSLQGALDALPDAPRVNTSEITAGIVAAVCAVWGYLMLWWGVSAGVIAAALLWAAAYALDLLESTNAALTRIARAGLSPRV